MQVSSQLAAINWSDPWLRPWRAVGEPIALQVLAGVAQHDALNVAARQIAAGLVAVHFVPQTDQPADAAYEPYIFDSGCCPTRAGLHDFFNGLAWLLFPQVKRRLNQLHMTHMAQTGIAPVRGPVRDALTVFDENAAFLQAPDALWNALAAKDWLQVFGPLRPLWGQATLVLFGHALLEKLVYPRKSITAHVYRAQPASKSIADLDAWVAADLDVDKLSSKPFAHLPVLGVPGWWPANQTAGFYADPVVFRASRK